MGKHRASVTLAKKLAALLAASLSLTLALTSVLPPGPGPAGAAGGATSVAAGGRHSCAVTPAGGVVCWGHNGSGQLGDGTTIERITPVAVSGLSSGVAAVTTGADHTCALTAGGAVKCWGLNVNGQLGDGTTTLRTVPVDVSGLGSGVVAVSAGGSHTCAITASAGIMCWGLNSSGQLGDSTFTDRHTPVNVTGSGGGATGIAAGGSHTCAITMSGIWLMCWGDNSHGQVGSGDPSDSAVPIMVAGGNIGGIAAGGFHTCGVVDGALKCWGKNLFGQLGDGTTTDRTLPVNVSGLGSGVATVDAGGDHTCALVSNAVKCWGYNIVGQLGDGTTTNRTTPVNATGLSSGVTVVTAGESHTCARTGGGIKCWGYNLFGQLGDGFGGTARLTPVDVSGLSSGVAAVSAGGAFTCAVTTGGGVKCWGSNEFGKLGDGTTTNRTTPVDVSGLTSGVAAVSAGAFHSCALTTGGGVKCWGYNLYGQLGDGTTIDRTTPVDVIGLSSGVAVISAGSAHTCAVTTGGAVKCWGLNDWGQVGDGTNTDRATAVDVSGLSSGVATVAAANAYTCAVTTGGATKCWGNNAYGQLGDGTTSASNTPVDVSGLGGSAASIGGGDANTCALTTGGGTKCWGFNGQGQLGDGTMTGHTTPGDVSGLGSGVAAISVGYTHACARTSGGGVKCWGSALNGELGIYYAPQQTTPVDVSGLGPKPVGGVAELPKVKAQAGETPEEASAGGWATSAVLLAGFAGFIALSGAAWYCRARAPR